MNNSTLNDLAMESIKTIEYFVTNVSIKELIEAKETMMKEFENAAVNDSESLMSYFNNFWRICFKIYEKFNNVSII